MITFCLAVSIIATVVDMEWKVSKAMRNTLDSSEREMKELIASEAAFKEDIFKDIDDEVSGKSLLDLRTLLFRKEPYKKSKENKRHPPVVDDRNRYKSLRNHSNWDLIGEDRLWDLIFLDHKPMGRRVKDAKRLLKRTKLLLIHDTGYFNENWMNMPLDFLQTSGHVWNDRPAFTEKSKTSLVYEDPGLPYDIKMPVWTTLIQGDHDHSEGLFKAVVEALKNYRNEIQSVYNIYNPDKKGYGTHVKLLLVSALMTRGDILEMGSGYFSTQLLHDIVQEEAGSRMLVTAESSNDWLQKHAGLQSDFHQLLHVPRCEEKVCYDSGWNKS